VSAAESARREWGALGLILIAAVWLQRDVLQSHFFADDFLFLDAVRGRGLFAAVFSRDPLANYLRPISRQLYFWVMSRLGNESPLPFYAANLALLLSSLVLVQRIARRFLGAFGATAACALLALHYAGDVPLRWASGSQDLLALNFALAALLLHINGRRWIAAAAYLLGLLSKETVLLTPLIAAALDAALEPASRTREHTTPRPQLADRVRTLAPMLIAAAAWAILWLATRSTRTSAGAVPHLEPGYVPAAFFHFVQSVFGLEWGAIGMSVGWKLPSLVATALALGGLALVGAPGLKRAAGGTRPSPRAALLAGAAWALCGLVPIAAVAPMWSAYYYLFALGAAALMIGASLIVLPRWVSFATVALFATLSARAAAREEFATAPGAWTTQSHVTPFYIERSTRAVAVLLEDLKRLHPTFPHNTTLFFGGVPPNLGWQTADGPLFRWAYHDPSVRSYFIADFSRERAARGPCFYFDLPGGHLGELWAGESPLRDITFTMLLEDHLQQAHDAMALWVEDPHAVKLDHYLMAWLDYALGATDSARVELARMGLAIKQGPTLDVTATYRSLAAGADTTHVIQQLMAGLERSPFDASGHALLADLLLTQDVESQGGVIEAFAARTLAPSQPLAWRRWAMIQLIKKRHRQAAATLDRYFLLGGVQAANDTEALEWRNQLRQILPGGKRAQEGLKLDLSNPKAAPR